MRTLVPVLLVFMTACSGGKAPPPDDGGGPFDAGLPLDAALDAGPSLDAGPQLDGTMPADAAASDSGDRDAAAPDAGSSLPAAIHDLAASAVNGAILVVTYTDAARATSYEERHAPAGSGSWSAPASLMNDRVTGLAASTSYDVQIRGVDAAGDGPWSNTATQATTAGLVIVAEFDASATGQTDFQHAVHEAIDNFESDFAANATVTIHFGWGELGGPSPVSPVTSLGRSNILLDSSTYTAYRAALSERAFSANALAAYASLPAADPTSGGAFELTTSHAVALGLDTTAQCWVGIGSTQPWAFTEAAPIPAGDYDCVGSVMHEISECLGRVRIAGWNGTFYEPLDLFAFSAPHARQWNMQGGYASLDDGTTMLEDFTSGGSSDPGDWAGGAIDCADAVVATTGLVYPFSDVDVHVMDAMGWQAR